MNPQQLPSYTQSYNAGYNPNPAISLSASHIYNPNNAGDLQWKHFLTNISPHVSRKLTTIGIFYIIIGILNIGLEIRLLTTDYFSYVVGFVNGGFLILIGILTIILCRQQVYVLSSLFVAVYFQLFCTIATFVVYCFIYSILQNYSSSCSYPYSYCYRTEAGIILIVDLIHSFVTFCLVIANLVIINSARRPPMTPVTSTYVVYNAQPHPMQTSFQNPAAMTMNQSSSA